MQSLRTREKFLINLEGEHMGIVIGKRGDTLDSLQYLTSLVVNKESEGYIKVVVDTENYREKALQCTYRSFKQTCGKGCKNGQTSHIGADESV